MGVHAFFAVCYLGVFPIRATILGLSPRDVLNI